MKKYFLAIVFLLSINVVNASEIKLCAGGKCELLDAQKQYPEIYTTVYGIFKSGISETMGICDSDSLFESCEKNGINYLGSVGVSETNFNINALNIIDARINPSNRNLEIINDYYTFVNGRRVLCSAAKDILTLEKGQVSLIARDIKCPYNLQFKSEKDHKYTIRMIDLDKRIIGVEYQIKDSVGADANPQGYAIISFSDIPSIDFNEINKAIAQGYTPKHQSNQAMTYQKGIMAPPQGMTSHVPMAPPMYNNMSMMPAPPTDNLSYQYQAQVQAMRNGQVNNQTYVTTMPGSSGMPMNYAPIVPPTPQQAQEFSYKSDLPYPWGYYYAPNTMPKETPKKQIPVVDGEKKGKKGNYTVGPLPKTLIEIDTSGNAATVTTPVTETTTISVEESVGVFNQDTFDNSVPK